MIAARSSVGLVLIAGVVLGACVGGAPPPTHYYTLRPPAAPADAQTGAAPGLAVGVRSFAVDPPYDQDRLVYRNGAAAAEVGFYAYHRWAAPLGRLVAVALADGLRGTAGIASIEPARATAEYTAALDGRLIYLEEVDAPGRQQARLSLEIVLTDRDGAVLWSATLAGSATGSTREVPEIMDLIRRAFDDVTRRAAGQISEALQEPAPGGAR